MICTQHYCAKCAGEQIRRNGHSSGRAKYQCKGCGNQGYFQPAAVEKARQYEQVDQLLLKRNSLRSIAIARATDVARNTVAERVKESAAASPVVAPAAAEKSATQAPGSVGTR